VYKHATITRYVLGIGPELQQKLDMLARRHPGRLNGEEDRGWQLEAIRKNIQASETGTTVPLPRDLLMDLRVEKREQELLLRQAKYDAEKEERLTAARLRVSSTITGKAGKKGKPGQAKRQRLKKKMIANQ
jgi:hypothetical protein